MSLALATKGVIAGIGFGSGGGEGGLYPSDYIASEIVIGVDTSEMSVSVDVSELFVSIDVESIELTIETYEED